MFMHARTQELLKLMADHNLKATDVATILGRSPTTVRIWRVADGRRPIPADTLELLRLKLKKS